MSGWIGVDLDGTLAYYDGWKGELNIGDPIPEMVNRVKFWLSKGKTVKIFTARISEGAINLDGTPHDIGLVVNAIEDWCEEHIGQKLEVTNVKDFGMVELWDDRAVQVVGNTGLSLQEYLKKEYENEFKI